MKNLCFGILTTSENQADNMRKLPENSRARKRLFTEFEEADVENFVNKLQEDCNIEKEKMKNKWNFDFEKEVALEGTFEWYRKEGDTWICMEPHKPIETKPTEIDDKFVPISKINEITPKTNKDDSVPVIKKRKREDGCINEKGARRKISFD